MEKDDDFHGTYTTEFRQYDPRTGRWYSVDPLGKDSPWQTPYNGMDNKPIIRNDVDGDCPTCVTGAVVGGVIELVFQVGEHMLVGDNFSTAFKKTDWVDVGIAAGTGAVTGAFTGGVDKLAKIVADPKKAKVLSLVLNFALDYLMSKVEEELGESVDKGALYAKLQKATGMKFGTPSMTNGLDANAKAEQVKTNASTGKVGEGVTNQKLSDLYPESKGYKMGTQIHAKLADGTEVVFDNVIVDSKGKVIAVVESKASTVDNFAIKSKGQKAFFKDGQSATFFGKKADDLGILGKTADPKKVARISKTIVSKTKTPIKNILKKIF